MGMRERYNEVLRRKNLERRSNSFQGDERPSLFSRISPSRKVKRNLADLNTQKINSLEDLAPYIIQEVKAHGFIEGISSYEEGNTRPDGEVEAERYHSFFNKGIKIDSVYDSSSEFRNEIEGDLKYDLLSILPKNKYDVKISSGVSKISRAKLKPGIQMSLF